MTQEKLHNLVKEAAVLLELTCEVNFKWESKFSSILPHNLE